MDNFAEFTEAGFGRLLQSLRVGGYRFARYGDLRCDRHVLWRHDVDFSMHRASRLAEIEAEAGAVATYFVNPRSCFYNLLEPDILRRLARVRDLGHDIGLHFDGGAVGGSQWAEEPLQEAVAREADLLAAMTGYRVKSFSWHNPDVSNLLDFAQAEIAGLVNAYGAGLRRDYVYCSDSNGYWRFTPMLDVIAAAPLQLHLLTHPEWWTPEPMSPSARLDRAILGRARANRAGHDALIASAGRAYPSEEHHEQTSTPTSKPSADQMIR